MGARNTLAFLQSALGALSAAPQEQPALLEALAARLVTSGFAVNASGVISTSVAPSFPALTFTTPLGPASGGTGIANNSANTITFSGNFGLTWTLTGTTALTLPTSGTLLTTTGSIAGLTGTLADARLSANVPLLNVATNTFVNMAGTFGLEANTSAGFGLGATHVSGTIRFYTGGSNLRWTIDAGGNFNGGTVGTGNDYVQLGLGASGTTWGVSGTGLAQQIGFYNANGKVGSITTNGSATAYNTSSDLRLKHSFGNWTDCSVLRQLRVRDAAFLADLTVRYPMFFAQEEYEHAPWAVAKGDDDWQTNSIIRQEWLNDNSKLVPLVIAGWQNHEARLAALERGEGRV